MSREHSPMVSVGIPSYNRAQCLIKAIDSVRNQTYSNLEIIVSDNASPDETEELVRIEMESDSRIKYYRQPENKGMEFNYRFVLQKATGKYFLFLSDDDWLGVDAISRYVEFLESNPSYALVSGNIDILHEDGTFFDRELTFPCEGAIPIFRTIKFYAKVISGSAFYGLMHREMAQSTPYFLRFAEDWHYVARIAFKGKIKSLNFIAYYKQKGGISQDFHKYARGVKEKKIWGYFPFVKIAYDALADIGWRCSIYNPLSKPSRVLAGLTVAAIIVGNRIFIRNPRAWAGKLLRYLGITTPKQKQLKKLLSASKEQVRKEEAALVDQD